MTARPPMLTMTTTGSPFERGRQQGQAVRDRALPWITETLKRLAQNVGAATPEEGVSRLRGEIRRWRDHAAAVDPDGIEEYRGLAAGLGLDEDTVFAIQVNGPLLTARRCTTVGFRDATGRPLLGKTDDIFRHEIGMNVLETVRPDRGHRFVALHFAGTTGTVAGMNERGLAMAMTGIPGPTLDQPGLPELLGLRPVLPTCGNVREALDYLTRLPVNWYGCSLLLGDAAGEMALVEKNGAGLALVPEQAGALVHTNHILDPDLAARSPQQSEPVRTNGIRRFANAQRLLESLPRTEDGMRQLYSNRGAAGAIWQEGEDGMFTDFAVLLVPTEGRFTVWTERPDTSPGRMVEMKKAFA